MLCHNHTHDLDRLRADNAALVRAVHDLREESGAYALGREDERREVLAMVEEEREWFARGRPGQVTTTGISLETVASLIRNRGGPRLALPPDEQVRWLLVVLDGCELALSRAIDGNDTEILLLEARDAARVALNKVANVRGVLNILGDCNPLTA